jgi:hypothetical protein
MLVKKGVSDNF